MSYRPITRIWRPRPQDWFFANLARDSSDSGVLDKITDLSAAEFAADLDFINAE